MTIPLHWLLLLLSSITGVQPPPDVPRETLVLVTAYPQDGSNVSAYWCGAGVSTLDPWCPSERGINTGDVTVSDRLWASPRMMQHALTHEAGHVLYGSDERAAEGYACKWVPLPMVTNGGTCGSDGVLR